ncbi:MAG: TIGR01459 family HAD-type hydrolase [Pseudomonadota bacterium]
MLHAPIPGLSTVADRYDAILCDVWGVLHDGLAPYEGAVDALRRFRARGPVVLVTNAARTSDSVAAQLADIGVDPATYDDIVSSGDVVRQHLLEEAYGAILHIGPEREHPVFHGTTARLVDHVDEADCVVVTALKHWSHTPDHYRDAVEAMAARQLPFVCANPDVIVDNAGRRIFCPGSLAKIYDDAGGTTRHFGKPHAPIYREALSRLGRQDVEAARILAIGDALATDVTGANRQGFGAYFVTGGIHAGEFGDDAALTERLSAEGLAVDHASDRLVW